MLGGNQKFQEVVDLVERWRPSQDYGHESKFQNELQEYLDECLNEGGQEMALGGQQSDDVVEREQGKSRADVAVNDLVGIEMKRDLSNRQTKKLRGQIEDYLDNYDFVIVCACGMEDRDGWRKLKNKYDGAQGDMISGQKQVKFIWKKTENYGEEEAQGQSGPTGLF